MWLPPLGRGFFAFFLIFILFWQKMQMVVRLPRKIEQCNIGLSKLHDMAGKEMLKVWEEDSFCFVL